MRSKQNEKQIQEHISDLCSTFQEKYNFLMSVFGYTVSKYCRVSLGRADFMKKVLDFFFDFFLTPTFPPLHVIFSAVA